jgi:hypothetical protein
MIFTTFSPMIIHRSPTTGQRTYSLTFVNISAVPLLPFYEVKSVLTAAAHRD